MIYLLAFPPLGNDRHQASFYIGYCDDDRDIADRLAEHRAGRGARITAAAVQRHGADALRLVWCIAGDRALERRLKRQNNHKRFTDPQRLERFLQNVR